MTAWKDTERRIARLLHGERTGNRGAATDDVQHGWLSVEVKHRRQLPSWLTAAMGQAQRNAPAGKLPIVVLHAHGARAVNDVVCVRMGDFLDWFGDDPLAAAEPGELAILAPDLTDGADEEEALHAHIAGLWGE